MFKALIRSMRPKQWTKNVVVFAGLFFAVDIFDPEKILSAVLAFAMFCLVSSGGYLINDIVDKDRDALHPRKRNRPIAAGQLSVPIAIVTAALLLLVSFYFSFRSNPILGWTLLIYLSITLGYSFILKRLVILDVLAISSGFMLRAIGGTLAIHEPISSWLIICTIFLALFLALNKRRAEIITIGEHAGAVRKTLTLYNIQLLDHMITTITAACLIAYSLYTLDADTVAKFGTRNLIFTLPFVIYGLFRYLLVTQNQNSGETPENLLFNDKPLILCGLLYATTVVLIIYF